MSWVRWERGSERLFLARGSCDDDLSGQHALTIAHPVHKLERHLAPHKAGSVGWEGAQHDWAKASEQCGCSFFCNQFPGAVNHASVGACWEGLDARLDSVNGDGD